MPPLRYLPIALLVSGLVSLFGSLIGSAVTPHWWFGFIIPPFSITGYDPTNTFWLFSLGLTLTGGLCGWLGYVIYQWTEKVKIAVNVTSHKRSNRKFCGLMIFAGANLSAIAWTDHAIFYKTGFVLPHLATTLLAFGGWLISLQLNYKIVGVCSRAADAAQLEPMGSVLRQALQRKKRGFTCLFIVMGIHIPLGYVLPFFPVCGDGTGCAAKWTCTSVEDGVVVGVNCIPFADCEGLGLTSAQCAFWQDETNASRTVLYDPSGNCAACADVISPLIAITQYMTIAALLCLVSLFYADLCHDPTTGIDLTGIGATELHSKLPPSPEKTPSSPAA